MIRRFLEKYKGKAIFKNMFVAVFSLAAVFAFLACISFLYWYTITEIEDEKYNDMNVLYSTSLMVDNHIVSIKDMMEVLRNDTYVKKILLRDIGDWDSDMMVAAQEIINSVTINPMFHSIYIIKDGDYILKCTNPSYPLNMQADKMMVETFYQSSFDNYAAKYYLDIYKKNQSLLYITNGEQNPSTGEKENGIIVSVDIGKVMENSVPAVIAGEQYFLMDESCSVIYTKGDKYKNGEKIPDFEIMDMIRNGNKKASEILEIGNEKYLCSSVCIEDSFYLVHMLPEQYVKAPIAHMRNIFIIISILIGILILLLAFAMSNWVYDPIDAVIKTTREGSKPGADMSERLKNTELSSIYQTYHSMVQTLNNLTMKKEQQELATYLNSKSSYEKLPEWVEETYGKEDIYSRVICLRISDTKDLLDNNTKEAIEFEIQTIVNVISQVLKPLGNVLVNPIDREHIAVILFTENSITEECLIKEIEEIFAITRELVHIGMDAGISNERKDFEQIASMYQMARAATAYRFVYGVNAIITENAMVEKALGGKADISLDCFCQCLKANDREGFVQEYNNITEELKNYSIQSARDVLLNMAAEMLKFKNSLNYNYVTLGSADYERLNEELGKYEYLNDAREWFHNMADEVWIILDRVKQKGREDVVDKALVYLNESYSDTNISAQYIADMYHITPSYFSRLFNERTGCAFPDYIATLRMEKAKLLLLKDSSKSIQEICEAVGYANSSYFTATFKKKYGITPGQFRKNHSFSDEN